MPPCHPVPMTLPRPDLDARWHAAAPGVTRWVLGGRPTVADELADLAAYAAGLPEQDAAWDRYGARGPVAALEARVAELLRMPAAAFFPSGVLAQQAALRVWCDRAGSRRVALPDVSHLLRHELDGPRELHGFEFVALTTGATTPTEQHVRAVPGRLGAVLLELPLRDPGHLLPTWDELVGVAAACRERGVALHLDGARLWESAPWWRRDVGQVAELADSVYVSFYKGLGGLAGACLAGPADVIDEARMWRTRGGGTLFTLAPYALAGLRGLDRALPLMGRCHEHAVALAAELQDRGARTTPAAPHALAFRLHAPGDADALELARVELAEHDRLGVSGGWVGGDVPGWATAEVTVGEATLAWTAAQAADAILTPWARVTLRAEPPSGPEARLDAAAGADALERAAWLRRAAAVLGLASDDALAGGRAVRRVLAEHDPWGLVAGGAPDDEYAPEAETIALRLAAAGGPQDAAAVAAQELTWSFGRGAAAESATPATPRRASDTPDPGTTREPGDPEAAARSRLGLDVWAAWVTATGR